MVYKPPYLFALLFIKTTLSACPSELLGQEVKESVKLPLSYRASITLIQGYEWDSLLVFFFFFFFRIEPMGTKRKGHVYVIGATSLLSFLVSVPLFVNFSFFWLFLVGIFSHMIC